MFGSVFLHPVYVNYLATFVRLRLEVLRSGPGVRVEVLRLSGRILLSIFSFGGPLYFCGSSV